ncbi:cyclic pyranopterin monophosphate synthase MoaC [Planctomycetota bacterium]
MDLSHIDDEGRVKMVDVGGKDIVKRTAIAAGHIRLSAEALDLLNKRLLKKGDALTAAQIAGIAAAKRTSELIPLCHNIPLDQVEVTCRPVDDGVEIQAISRCSGKTGVEMEALTAVSVAALTVYDMCKAVDKEMEIGSIRLLEKTKKVDG